MASPRNRQYLAGPGNGLLLPTARTNAGASSRRASSGWAAGQSRLEGGIREHPPSEGQKPGRPGVGWRVERCDRKGSIMDPEPRLQPDDRLTSPRPYPTLTTRPTPYPGWITREGHAPSPAGHSNWGAAHRPRDLRLRRSLNELPEQGRSGRGVRHTTSLNGDASRTTFTQPKRMGRDRSLCLPADYRGN